MTKRKHQTFTIYRIISLVAQTVQKDYNEANLNR